MFDKSKTTIDVVPIPEPTPRRSGAAEAIRAAALAATGQAAGNLQLTVITLASALEVAANELETQGQLIAALMERP